MSDTTIHQRLDRLTRMTALGDCASILHRHMRCAYARPDWEARHAILRPVLDDIAALLDRDHAKAQEAA